MPDTVCLFGPPGTGKTTSLTRAIAHYVQDYGADKILATSFTKAGARELAGRNQAVLEEHMMGTLHALCYRLLDAPPLAETLTQKGGWNARYPDLALTQSSRHDDTATTESPDEEEGETTGAQALHAYNVWRSQACRRTHPPETLGAFPRLWEAWKGEIGARDFTDLLLDAVEVIPVAPGNPRLLIADEAQDFTPLQWQLLAHWGRHCDRVILAGDDDQALYTWAGASPQPMLDLSEHEKIILDHSYRLPQAVYDYATAYLDRITTRQPKTWQPRDAMGTLAGTTAPWHRAAQAHVERALSTAGETCAVLAPCSYMIKPLLAWMRAEGIPFANPWRTRRGDWNPLARPARGVSAVTRLLDYLRPPSRLWTWQELASWLPLVRVRGTLRPEAKALLALHDDTPHVCQREDLAALFLPEALGGVLAGALPWLESRLLADRARVLAYPLRVLRQHGRAALLDPPRIFVGTCHSVKGGEADTVVLCTDLSRRFAMARAAGGDTADAVERMLYVGATRARETLVVCPRA